jgi:hypothetical protein
VTFKYEDTGLPNNQRFKDACDVCVSWLRAFMPQFGAEGHARFMMAQPVGAAKRLLELCPDTSEDAIVLVLMGPNKGALLEDADFIKQKIPGLYSDRAASMLKTMTGQQPPQDPGIARDLIRIKMNEDLSGMNDQIIGRQNIDAHHAVRWQMLESFEAFHKQVKGMNPTLDPIYEDALKKSRQSLEALGPASLTPPAKKGPRPHGF